MILVLILGVYALALWRMSVPLTGDEKVYLSIALEMKERGSWLIPYLFDRPNFLKPPFQYWMTLLGWKLFGLSLFGALIPSVMALVISAYLIQKISGRTGSLAALLFSSTLATMTYGTTAQMEIWIVLFYVASWFFYLEKKFFLTFLAVGIMAWIKGPLYPLLFVGSIFFKEWLDQNLSSLRRPKFFVALVFGAGVGLLWYMAAASSNYAELRDTFFGRENFGKLQTQQGTIVGLWGEFFITLFPVLFLVFASLLDKGFSARARSELKFWIAYGLLPALFFSFFPYRVNTYLFLLTPIAAWVVVESPEFPLWFKYAMRTLVSLTAVVLLILLYRTYSGGWLSLSLCLALFGSLVFWTIAHFRFSGKWIAICSLLIVNLVRLGATELGEWDLHTLREQAMTPLAYRIEPNQEDIWHERGLISAALGKSIQRVRNQTEEENFLSLGGAVILSEEQTPILGTQCLPWKRLKRRMKFPMRQLLESGLSIDDSEIHRVFHICRK